MHTTTGDLSDDQQLFSYRYRADQAWRYFPEDTPRTQSHDVHHEPFSQFYRPQLSSAFPSCQPPPPPPTSVPSTAPSSASCLTAPSPLPRPFNNASGRASLLPRLETQQNSLSKANNICSTSRRNECMLHYSRGITRGCR